MGEDDLGYLGMSFGDLFLYEGVSASAVATFKYVVLFGRLVPARDVVCCRRLYVFVMSTDVMYCR